jgi:hypothetical protein
MALDAKTTITHPIQIDLTAGSSSGVALLIASGAPTGAADPQTSAGKGSLYIRIDATDDEPALYQKVDADGANDDWVPVVVHKSEAEVTLENHLTIDADKRVYFRDTDMSIYSDAASKLSILAPSGTNIDKMKVGGGTYFDSFLAGSGTIAFGAIAKGATSTACLGVTGLTQEHKLFISPSTMSACLNINAAVCLAAGASIGLTVSNTSASEASDAGNVVFGYMAIAACA